MEDTFKCNPDAFFNPQRLDLVVKYLYAKDILRSKQNDAYRSLYLRHIFMRTGGIEPFDQYAKENNSKLSLESYDAAFKDLVKNMRNTGYDHSRYIPLMEDGNFANGAHRIAAASVLGLEVSAAPVAIGEQRSAFDFAWFENNGFSLEDKLRILKGFTEVRREACTIFVIWRPIHEYLGHVRKCIADNLDIVGEVDLDFEDNFPAFARMIYDLYLPRKMRDLDSEHPISRKIDLFQKYRASCTIILACLKENTQHESIFDISIKIKNDIREKFDFCISKDIFASLHASSSVDELKNMANILLSPNNLYYLRLRMLQKYDQRVLDLCELVYDFCEKRAIDNDKVCIVASSTMNILGVKETGDSDIDFITTSNHREQFGDSPVHFTHDLHLVMRNYCRNELGDIIIDDDTVIDCDEYHFIFNGLKFLNLGFIKERKKFDSGEKHKLYLRQIILFEQMMGLFDHKKIVGNRILQESLYRNLHRQPGSFTQTTSSHEQVHVTRATQPDWSGFESLLREIFVSGQFTNDGRLAKALERKLAEFLQTPYLSLCNSGTASMQLAIRAAGLSGKEVITTPFSHPATVTALLWEGCRPVFADIDEHSLCLSPERVSEKITKHTAGVIPVHIYGIPCDIEGFSALAGEHSLRTVYDGAHAFGCKLHGRSLLTFGDFSVASFHATQAFHTAEGGAVVSATAEGKEAVDLLRAFGRCGDTYYFPGINARMSELHAALGLSLLPSLEENLLEREKVIGRYDELLAVRGVRHPVKQAGLTFNNSYYPIIFDEEAGLLRVLRALNERNIFPRRYFYPSLNTLPYLEEQQSCPVAESVASRVLCLPLHGQLEQNIVEQIVEIIIQNL